MAQQNPGSVQQAELPKEEIYRQWLGLKGGQPSCYALLAVPDLLGDASAIFHAGRRAKRKVRAYQIGPYRKQALALLGEIGQAVAVLTNPEKKRAYDNELQRRWRTTIEELYKGLCEGAPREPAVLESWLTACSARGVPVTRLLPAIVWRMGSRVREWPVQGEHKVPLPVNLWLYRDAVILGQCLHVGSLEKRVETVKTVQKLLGITEGLARIVAEDVSRGLHVFAQLRFVQLAKKDPVGLLVRLGRRVRRFGGHLGHRGKVLAAITRLLGRHKTDLDQALALLEQPAVELSAGQEAARAVRHARDEVRQGAEAVRGFLQDWVFDRPELLIGLGFLVGLAALVVTGLVVTGVWTPWAPPEAPTAQAAPPTVPAPPEPPAAKAPPPPPAPPVKPPAPPVVAPPPAPPLPSAADVPGFEEFIRRYPSGKAPVPPPEPKPPTQNQKPPAEEDPDKPKTRPGVRFFGSEHYFKGEKRPDGTAPDPPNGPATPPPNSPGTPAPAGPDVSPPASGGTSGR